MAGDGDLSNKMSQKTTLFGLKLWELVGITVGIFIALILFILALWLISRKKLDRLSAASNTAIAAAAEKAKKQDKTKKKKEKKKKGEITSSSNSSRFPFSLCNGSVVGGIASYNSANHSSGSSNSSSSAGNSSSIPAHSKEIKVDRVVQTSGGGGVILTITDSTGDGEPEQVLVRVGIARKSPGQKTSICTAASTPNSASLSIAGKSEASAAAMERQASAPPPARTRSHAERNNREAEAGDREGEGEGEGRDSSCSYGYGYGYVGASGELGSASGLSSGELGFGWGHWFTLRELQIATNGFSSENVLGEGGYGIVYKGKLPNDTMVAVKSLLNNMGQAEREFRVEVEAIGRVRHKNLVRFLGYCIEGTHRMLVYEYVDNGNLEQWLHGSSSSCILTWENRMRIIIGTAKALAYLHEALEPKVVHRDIKASNILIDSQWNAKVSDFGLAKMLGAGKSHVTTRVMGTFGYVAPEYASTGLLNERSDVYSFGVLVLETITGRDPVDYSRPTGEVNLLDWLKVMVGNRRSEEVVDPKLSDKPAPRVLKKVLLIALRCVDPESEKRPRMGHVVHMLESEDFPYRDARSLLTSSA